MHRHVEQQHIHPPHSLRQTDRLLCCSSVYTWTYLSLTHCDTLTLSAHTALDACLSLCTHMPIYTHSLHWHTHTCIYPSYTHISLSLSHCIFSLLHLSVCLDTLTQWHTDTGTLKSKLSPHITHSLFLCSMSLTCTCLLSFSHTVYMPVSVCTDTWHVWVSVSVCMVELYV